MPPAAQARPSSEADDPDQRLAAADEEAPDADQQGSIDDESAPVRADQATASDSRSGSGDRQALASEVERVSTASSNGRDSVSTRMQPSPEQRPTPQTQSAGAAATLGVFGAVSALGFTFVGLFSDLHIVMKVAWFVGIVLFCASGTALILYFDRQLSASREMRRDGSLIGFVLADQVSARRKLLILTVAAFSSISAPPIVGSWIESLVIGKTPCVSVVGAEARDPDVARAFLDAYNLHAGNVRIGCPTAPVREIMSVVGNGYHQNFLGPVGPSVILAADDDRAYLLEQDYLEAYLAIGDQDPRRRGELVPAIAGYPYNAGEELPNGLMLEVGAGGFGRSAVLKKNGGDWQWVSPELWTTYSVEYGGPEGELGYPISGLYPWGNGGMAQAFETGKLCYVTQVKRC